MNQTQRNRELYPGVEIRDVGPTHRSFSFSAPQDEGSMLRCLKNGCFPDMDIKRCVHVNIKMGESWYTVTKYFSSEDAITALFDLSLSKYITKVALELKEHDQFVLWIKVHDIGGHVKDTNIGPNFLEYVSSLFG